MDIEPIIDNNICSSDCKYCYQIDNFDPAKNTDICKKDIKANLEYILEIHCREQKQSEYNNNVNSKNIAKDSVSFSGGGYNCVYHLGVIKYIFTHIHMFKNTKYLGASGGAGIVGIALAYEKDPNNIHILKEILKEIIRLNGQNLQLYQQVKMYTDILCKYIDEDKFNRYIKDSNRCYISLTDITNIIPKNVIKSDFDSYAEYIDTLRASACIPYILDDRIRNINNHSYLDGGLSNNLPTLSKKTLKISCLNYPFMSADIYPKIISNILCSFSVPDKNYIMNMFDLGYSDTSIFLSDYEKKVDDIIDELTLEDEINDIINSF